MTSDIEQKPFWNTATAEVQPASTANPSTATSDAKRVKAAAPRKPRGKSKMSNVGKVDAAATATSKTRGGAGGVGGGDARAARHWSGAELEALLEAALGGPVPSARFIDKIPGRSTNQCRQAWLKILPVLRKTLRERGGEGEA